MTRLAWVKDCPTCGGTSEKTYRCTECGTDLADVEGVRLDE